VGMADAGRLDLDQHLALAWAFEVDIHYLQGLACGNSYGGACLHLLDILTCLWAGLSGRLSGIVVAICRRTVKAGRLQRPYQRLAARSNLSGQAQATAQLVLDMRREDFSEGC